MFDKQSILANFPGWTEFKADPRVTRRKNAFIAETMRQFVKINPKSRIKIVGLDGANVGASIRKYPWLGDILEWVQNGSIVEYLLIAPSPLTKRLLKGELSNKRNSLTVLTIDRQKTMSDSVREKLKVFRTFHFGLFLEPKQLWIEENHFPGVTHATDCAYADESTLRSHTEFFEFLEQTFEQLKNQFGRSLFDEPIFTVSWEQFFEDQSLSRGERDALLRRFAKAARQDHERAIRVRVFEENIPTAKRDLKDYLRNGSFCIEDSDGPVELLLESRGPRERLDKISKPSIEAIQELDELLERC